MDTVAQAQKDWPHRMFRLQEARHSGLTVYIMLTVAAVLWGCHAFDGWTVPEQLIGTWETAEPRYEGCTLQVTAESIIFTSGVRLVDINTIRGVRRVEQGKGVLYDIDYENKEGGKFRLSLYYIHSEKLEIIRFKHQPKIEWVRERNASQALRDRLGCDVHVHQAPGIVVASGQCAGIQA